MPADDVFRNLLVALGIGLLIGAERERRKVVSAAPAAAGLRSFTVAALLGALAMVLGGMPMLAVAAASATGLAVVSYWRTYDRADPGITTELALVATVLLGGLSVLQPQLAGSIAVIVTIALAARMPLHRFVGEMVTEGEVSDLLIVAGSSLVVLPLLPDRAMGPFLALNPHAIWLVVILILGINAVGHAATRWLGARLGVPLLGLASGFVSSSATIAAMGAWVRAAPASLRMGAAGAVLSTVATFVQLALVIDLTDHASFLAVRAPLAAAGAMALALGAYYTLRSWHQPPAAPPAISRSFSLVMALGFAAMLSVMLVVVAGLRTWLGETGLIGAAAIGGALDVHAAAIAVATQVVAGDITARQSVVPILVACSTSTAAKIMFSAAAGTRPFGLRVIPAQLLIVGAAWGGAWVCGILV